MCSLPQFCRSGLIALTSRCPTFAGSMAQGTVKRPRDSPKPKFLCTSRALTTFVSKYFQLEANDLENFLSRHNLDSNVRFSETHAQVKVCPFCKPTRGEPSNEYKLGISRESGAYNCFRCGSNGSWMDLKKRLSGSGNFPVQLSNIMKGQTSAAVVNNSATGTLPRKYQQQGSKENLLQMVPGPIDSTTRDEYVDNLWNKKEFQPVQSWLTKKRGLSEETLRKFGVGAAKFKFWDGTEWIEDPCVAFPLYNDDGQIVRYKIRSSKAKHRMALYPKGASWGLFGLPLATESEVILCEGELDAMSIFQDTGKAAVSLPNGASSLPLQVLPFLEQFALVTIWMDADAPGQSGAQQFSKKLGISRCKLVSQNLPEGCKDANDILRAGHSLSPLLETATAIPHDSVVTFYDLRESVHDFLTNKDIRSGVKSQTLPRLNDLLKGLRRGELTIVSGHTGVGKTTLLSQLSLDFCAQGVVTMWGSFEVSNVKLAADMLRQFYSAIGGRGNLLKQYDKWADMFGSLPMLFMRYHGSNPVERIIDAMEYGNYVYDCSHFILDNLHFMTYGQGSGHRYDRMEVMDQAISELRAFATRANVHITLVVHPRKEADSDKIQLASVYGSAKATQEADNVVLIHRTPEGPQVEIKKNRYDGSLGSLKLRFESKSKLFIQADKEATRLEVKVLSGWGSDIAKPREQGFDGSVRNLSDERVPRKPGIADAIRGSSLPKQVKHSARGSANDETQPKESASAGPTFSQVGASFVPPGDPVEGEDEVPLASAVESDESMEYPEDTLAAVTTMANTTSLAVEHDEGCLHGAVPEMTDLPSKLRVSVHGSPAVTTEYESNSIDVSDPMSEAGPPVQKEQTSKPRRFVWRGLSE